MQRKRDKQRVRGTNSDCLVCLSPLCIEDKHRQLVRVQPQSSTIQDKQLSPDPDSDIPF